MQLIKRIFGLKNTNTPSKVEESSIIDTSEKFVWPTPIKPFEDMPHVELRFWEIESNRVTIFMPGFDSNGMNAKYATLISYLVNNNLSSVFLTNHVGHFSHEDTQYSIRTIEQIRRIVEYVLARIQNTQTPVSITLIGTSAGGGAVGAIADQFAEIKDIIMISPAMNVYMGFVEDGLLEFEGNLTIIRSDSDNISPSRLSQELMNSAPVAKKREVIMKNASHAFHSQEEIDFILKQLKLIFEPGEG